MVAIKADMAYTEVPKNRNQHVANLGLSTDTFLNLQSPQSCVSFNRDKSRLNLVF